MHAGLALGHWWPVLALALPAAGLYRTRFSGQ
jgi:fatty acid desaturase